MSGTSVTVKRAWGLATQGGQQDPLGAQVAEHNKVITDLDALETAVNAALGAVGDGVLQGGTLAVSGTTDQFKTTTELVFRKAGIQRVLAATDSLEFVAAPTINTAGDTGSFFGAFLVEATNVATPVVSAKAVSADQVYTSAALALAALPAVTAGSTKIGSIVVGANVDSSWTSNTDDMVAGSDCASVVLANESSIYAAPADVSITAAKILTTESQD